MGVMGIFKIVFLPVQLLCPCSEILVLKFLFWNVCGNMMNSKNLLIWGGGGDLTGLIITNCRVYNMKQGLIILNN